MTDECERNRQSTGNQALKGQQKERKPRVRGTDKGEKLRGTNFISQLIKVEETAFIVCKLRMSRRRDMEGERKNVWREQRLGGLRSTGNGRR